MNVFRTILLLAIAFGLCPSRDAAADDLRPLLVEITEIQDRLFRVTWVVPSSLPAFYQPSIVMPESCTAAATGSSTEGDDLIAAPGTAIYRCAIGLDGESISIAYPGATPPVPTAIRLRYSSGEVLSKFLAPQAGTWRVPASESALHVVRDYTWLGTEHILTSMDHLLFVLMLVYIGGTLPRILLTVTGFTIAHSITLALSTLQWIDLPSAPVEASIALSIVFVAREVAVHRTDTLTWRYPALISSVFGLLHGLGFASALQEIGLPQRQFAVSLLSFNLGVELGQIAFILLVLALLRASAPMQIRWPPSIARLPVYATGAFSSFWVMRNVVLMIAGKS